MRVKKLSWNCISSPSCSSLCHKDHRQTVVTSFSQISDPWNHGQSKMIVLSHYILGQFVTCQEIAKTIFFSSFWNSTLQFWPFKKKKIWFIFIDCRNYYSAPDTHFLFLNNIFVWDWPQHSTVFPFYINFIFLIGSQGFSKSTELLPLLLFSCHIKISDSFFLRCSGSVLLPHFFLDPFFPLSLLFFTAQFWFHSWHFLLNVMSSPVRKP